MRNSRSEARQKDIERFIVDHFDLAGLKKIGFIKSSRRSRVSMLAIEKRIVTYFMIQNIYQFTEIGKERYPMKVDASIFSEN